MSTEYRVNPPWRLEEERVQVSGEITAKSYARSRYTESSYFILDGKNRVVAMIGDVRDAELIVDLANKFFDQCTNGQDSDISHATQN